MRFRTSRGGDCIVGNALAGRQDDGGVLGVRVGLKWGEPRAR
jgi:hypothetical protein